MSRRRRNRRSCWVSAAIRVRSLRRRWPGWRGLLSDRRSTDGGQHGDEIPIRPPPCLGWNTVPCPLARAGANLRDEPAKTRIRIVAPMPYGGERERPDRERRRIGAQFKRFAVGLDELCRHGDD